MPFGVCTAAAWSRDSSPSGPPRGPHPPGTSMLGLLAFAVFCVPVPQCLALPRTGPPSAGPKSSLPATSARARASAPTNPSSQGSGQAWKSAARGNASFPRELCARCLSPRPIVPCHLAALGGACALHHCVGGSGGRAAATVRPRLRRRGHALHGVGGPSCAFEAPDAVQRRRGLRGSAFIERVKTFHIGWTPAVIDCTGTHKTRGEVWPPCAHEARRGPSRASGGCGIRIMLITATQHCNPRDITGPHALLDTLHERIKAS